NFQTGGCVPQPTRLPVVDGYHGRTHPQGDFLHRLFLRQTYPLIATCCQSCTVTHIAFLFFDDPCLDQHIYIFLACWFRFPRLLGYLPHREPGYRISRSWLCERATRILHRHPVFLLRPTHLPALLQKFITSLI